MSMYVLDTDVLTLLFHNHPRLQQNVIGHLTDDVCVTVVSVEEQLMGWYSRVRRAKQVQMLADAYGRLAESVKLLSDFKILAFSVPAIYRYQALQALKLGVKKTDLRIAAITLEHAGILVTRNLRDFRRVPGLVIEDWSV